MTEQRSMRFGILGVVGALLVGLVWLGFVRYQAEHRSQQRMAPAAGGPRVEAPVAAQPVPAASGPAAPQEGAAEKVVVHVAGAVVHPGVYTLDKGARVADAIAAAGGPLPEGVQDALNLAEAVQDSQKIMVYTKQELAAAPAPAVGQSTAMQAAPKPVAGKVSLNTASADQLDKVPYVTPTMAKSIVEYRAKHGPFKKVEDLDNVPGIGPATIEKLRPNVTL